MGGISLIAMRKLQQLGDSAMWLVIIGVLSFGLGILALVGLLALVKELIVELAHEADSTDEEGTPGKGDVGRVSGQRCVMTE
jgi:hypothetical protein